MLEMQLKASGELADSATPYYYPSADGVEILDTYELTVVINATAVAGTVDAKLQCMDPGSGEWFDVTNGAIAQMSSAGVGIVTVDAGFGNRVRVAVTVGTDDATLSVGLIGRQRGDYTQGSSNIGGAS